jgi:20S proteasome alpha/beta subunit
MSRGRLLTIGRISARLLPLQSILTYNGGDIICMAGKNCVGIAADSRLGIQAQTVATDFQKIFKV